MEQTATEIMGRVCRRIRSEPVAQVWLRKHPDTRQVLAAVTFDDELA
jgi:hypothetical protein